MANVFQKMVSELPDNTGIVQISVYSRIAIWEGGLVNVKGEILYLRYNLSHISGGI